ncbi:MAG TPA: response regulator, partial [Pyrinomonadaceae bacterium]|nr:response regulator [Pyrinomonadaceae bacterium]
MSANVLIVEDEKHLADGLRFNLQAEGYRVETVADGEAALARLLGEPQRFDAVVLDVMLPGVDGFEVAARLRRAGQF